MITRNTSGYIKGRTKRNQTHITVHPWRAADTILVRFIVYMRLCGSMTTHRSVTYLLSICLHLTGRRDRERGHQVAYEVEA